MVMKLVGWLREVEGGCTADCTDMLVSLLQKSRPGKSASSPKTGLTPPPFPASESLLCTKLSIRYNLLRLSGHTSCLVRRSFSSGYAVSWLLCVEGVQCF